MLKIKAFTASSNSTVEELANKWLFITQLKTANLISVTPTESDNFYTIVFCYVSTDMNEEVTLDKVVKIMTTLTKVRLTENFYNDLRESHNPEHIGRYDWTVTGINQDGTLKLTNGKVELDEVAISCLDLNDFII